MRVCLIAFVALLLASSILRGQDKAEKAKADTPEQAADNVLAAFKAKKAEALKAFAEKDNPDPWLVADELCFRGEHGAAEAFAKAAPRTETEELPRCVARMRGREPGGAARSVLAAAKKALAAKKPNEALAAIDAAPEDREGVIFVRLLHQRGLALRLLRRLEASAQAYLAAADAAERLGWYARAAWALHEGGVSCYYRADYPGTLNAWERKLRVQEELGDRARVSGTLNNLGTVHRSLGNYATALKYQQRALKLDNELGNRLGVSRSLNNLGLVYANLGDYPRALDYHARSLKLKEELGDRAGVAASLNNLGSIHFRLGDYPKALGYYARSLKLKEELGDRAGMATSLNNLGNVYKRLGDYQRALDHHKRSLKLEEELGNRAGVAASLNNLGNIHRSLGNYATALKYQQRALKLDNELGNRLGVSRSLNNLGIVYEGLGDYPRALDYHARSLKLKEELGDRAGVAASLNNLGIVYENLGDYPKALDCQERSMKLLEELGNRAAVAIALGNTGAIYDILGDYPRALDHHERSLRLRDELGDRAGVAASLNNLGCVYYGLGDNARALDHYQRSLKLEEELGHRAGVSRSLNNLGNVYESLGDYPKALEYYERSLELDDELGDRAGVAAALGNIGATHGDLGDYAKALDYLERALKMKEELGDRAGAARTLNNIGVIHQNLGDYAKALDHRERALALGGELGALKIEVRTLSGLAALHIKQGHPAEAALAARRGVEKLPLLVGRLAEEQGAKAREQWTGLFETGVAAGKELEDPVAVSYFLESGRAGALLESLGGREALGGVIVPKELRRDEIAARAAVVTARARHGRALEAGDLTKIRAARDAIEEAHGKVLEVASKIRRAAKAAADVEYPKATALKDIQKSLAKDEALVQYALLSEEAVALVVTAGDARIVPLGETRDIETACTELKAKDRGKDPSAAISVLQKKVIAHLDLDKRTKRLLVSPHGLLANVPFALLVADRETVMVPSGTTYGVLLDERGKRGEGILALGDPDYGVKAHRYAVSVMRSGAQLVPLPGTRAEVKAVGDVQLVGTAASELEFRKLASRQRWRAVHFACHGLIRTDQPQLSSLALTPDERNDGLLTVLEVFRMKIPADLVVLSACETGKGKVYKAEGIIGFTRAFMMAGAPRVIVSLWKVDDAATKALMVKFYERWNPKDGSTGLPTATALKKAQEFVASHEKWKHPYYWAAWQLWGLPD